MAYRGVPGAGAHRLFGADDHSLFETLRLSLFTSKEQVVSFVGLQNFETLSATCAGRRASGTRSEQYLLPDPHGGAEPDRHRLAALLSVPAYGRSFYRTAFFCRPCCFVIVGFCVEADPEPAVGVAPSILAAIGPKWVFGPGSEEGAPSLPVADLGLAIHRRADDAD
jgi:hypothetical protein